MPKPVKKNIEKNTLQTIMYYLFLLLIIIVPMGFWKDFDNGFDLVKSSLLKIIGGIFIILCAIFLLSSKSQKNNTGITFNKSLDIPVLLFIFAAILSTIFSVNIFISVFGNYETQIGLITYVYFIIIYFLLPVVITSDDIFRKIFLVIEVLALISAVFSIVEYFGVNPFNLKPENFIRPVTPIGHPVFTAGFLIIILPYSVLNTAGKKSFALRLFFPLVIFAGIIATQTRSAYIALLIQLIFFSAVFPALFKRGKTESKKYIRYPVYLLAAILILIVSLSLMLPENPFVKRFLSVGTITNLPRWFLWKDSIGMFLHYPLTGTGVSAFSNLFENYESYQLRFAEIKGFFVNPHSNYLNILCTMGILGLISYVLILFQAARLSFKSAVLSSSKHKTKNFFYAAIVSLAGYGVFGIADFDDVTILFYFFVLLSLIKFKQEQPSNIHLSGAGIINEKFKIPLFIILTAFSLYNIIDSVTDLHAQDVFSGSKSMLKNGNFTGYLNEINRAIQLKPNESNYRYDLAYNILVHSGGLQNREETKRNLLERARYEAALAEKNYRSKLECLALRSLIELESGNEKEAMELKDEIFRTDTTQFQYRTNLAIYYLNHGNYDAAIYEINSILNWDIKNISVMTLKVHYLMRKGYTADAIEACYKILSIEPRNSFAKQILSDLKNSR